MDSLSSIDLLSGQVLSKKFDKVLNFPSEGVLEVFPSFYGCNFMKEVIFMGGYECDRLVEFKDCTFSENLVFFTSHIKTDLIFDNISINGNLIIDASQFYASVSLLNCTINGEINFCDTIFHKQVCISRLNVINGTNIIGEYKDVGGVEFRSGLIIR